MYVSILTLKTANDRLLCKRAFKTKESSKNELS